MNVRGRPRACLCASIAIFRIARASLDRALSAQTPLDPLLFCFRSYDSSGRKKNSRPPLSTTP